ncbi:hypothetical protein N7467_007342 [Penicillium canescens]|nr:hypothetical protein N7467_007342 [Penicillium canescens]
MVSNMVNGTTGHALDLTVLGLNSGTSMVSALAWLSYPSGRLLPHEHLARSAAYKASSASTSVRHGEQCLLYLVLGNAGIQPALTEWISMLQLAGGAPSQPLPGFRPRAHHSSGADVDLAAAGPPRHAWPGRHLASTSVISLGYDPEWQARRRQMPKDLRAVDDVEPTVGIGEPFQDVAFLQDGKGWARSTP